MRLERGSESVEYVVTAIRRLLDDITLLSLSTSFEDRIWTCTVFFSFDEKLNLFFLSDPQTQHCTMISRNPRISGAIYSSAATWGKSIQGIQFQGHAEKVPLAQIVPCGIAYLKRFPVAQQVIASPQLLVSDKISSRIYRIVPSLIQIYDENTFGDDDPIRRLLVG